MLKKIIEKKKRKIEESKSNRNNEEKENYSQEDGDDDVQVGTLQTDEGRRCLALMLQKHWNERRREINEHAQRDSQQQQNTCDETDMGFSDVEDVTPQNLVTGFVVVNIGNSGNSANNDVNSPDTDTHFHVLD